jgi:uncharacterized protein
MNQVEILIEQAQSLMKRLERILLPPESPINWDARAWQWQAVGARSGYLKAVSNPHLVRLDDLCNLEAQKAEIVRNTTQFVNKLPANHVLLTGARGTGKSTLVKALLNTFGDQGLRLIEVDKQDLINLPEIVELIEKRPERFIIFCDDLSFEANDPGYKALKVVLDGSIAMPSDNLLIYATSNRKHLMSEWMHENLETQYLGEEIRPGETAEEKLSLSERFGLWLSFYTFDQDEYLKVAQHWLKQWGILEFDDKARRAALQFALTRGARSGRVAYQFSKDYAGRIGLGSGT